MKHAELSKEMTVYDLAQLMMAGFERLESRVEYLEENCAMKSDLERFATKDDLAKCATKKDLERFATKKDLERFAAKKDLERFATRDDFKNVATKEDFLKMEKRLSDRVDRNYIHVNRRIDVLAEKIA